MGLDALTYDADGRNVFPDDADGWREWVSAGRTRNWMLGDPLLDWLDRYGRAKGFRRDDELPGYDARYDFTTFIMRQGQQFEAAVLSHLRGLLPVARVSDGWEDIRRLTKGWETYNLMCQGVPAIHQGVLFDAVSRTYGAPDLLVRSDHLARLFPDALPAEEAGLAAPDLPGAGWHYRVVDIKFTTLHLNAGSMLGNAGSAKAYKAQLFLYSQALGRLQGYTPPLSYLLGRGWQQMVRNQGARGANCMERLAPIVQAGVINKDPLAGLVSEAVAWVRRLRRQGAEWQALPAPSVPELWPDMTGSGDGLWHHAKVEIAHALDDLTLLWQVGAERRATAHRAGVTRWPDPRCTPALLGVHGEKQQPVLHALLDVNQHTDGPPVQPAHIRAAEDRWRMPQSVEFFVDFETVSDLDDDFSRIPERGGQPLIFMIGCGHMEDGAWQFQCFTARALTEDAEADVIDGWLAHMEAVRQRLAPGVAAPLVFHWSKAELSTFETAYNSAVERHKDKSGAWQQDRPAWFDFLGEVVRAEPVVVRGALAFGLKPVARALHAHGLISTNWEDGLADGLSAMVAAWWCGHEAAAADVPLDALPLMQEVARYNEIDCRTMAEIIQYLRAHH